VWVVATTASEADSRKQTDPSASGRQTECWYWATPALRKSAAKVETLKNRVPANWIPADHQSSQSTLDFQAPGRQRPVRRNWTKPARVKKIEPMKKVRLAAPCPTRSK